MRKVAAGIVTFHPEISRLKDNISAIQHQVSEIVIIDNCSDNIFEIQKLSDEYNCVLIRNDENRGIARALNQIMMHGKHKFDWIITLDQDSVCPSDIIEKASKYMNDESVGIICPRIYEKGCGKLLSTKKNAISYIKRCITSAAITRISVWEKVEGFNEELFIDYVDFDFSTKVTLSQYKIIQMGDVILEHELGNSFMKKIFLWEFRVTSHSALREYYIGRNVVYYIRKYRKQINVRRDCLSLIKAVLFIMLFEEQKKNKMQSIVKGIKAGTKIDVI